MIISIPNNIKSEFEGYNFLSTLIDKHKDVVDQYITFDFSKVRFIQANLCAVFGILIEILESNNNKIRFENFHENVEEILRKNNFLSAFGFSPLEDTHNTSLKYQKFTPNDDTTFNNYIQQKLLKKQGFPRLSKRLTKKITENIFEIYENARTHGKCGFIHACGQFYPKDSNKPLQFTIVDKGINIKQNVSIFLNKDIDATEAIEWAMQRGNTTKTGNTPGGLGLAIIFDFIRLNNGKIQVISSNGYYEYFNNNVDKKALNSIFEGTIVNIKFNLNDEKSYILTDEADESFENIF